VTKGPRIYTSDPNNKEMLVTLTAEGVASFDSTTPAAIFPSRVTIPLEKRGEPFRLVIKNVSHQPINPAIVFAPTDIVDVQMPDGVIAAGDERDIFVTLRDDFDQLSKKISFTLSMMDYQDTRYTIPIEIGNISAKASHANTPPASSKSASTDKTPLRPTGSDKKGGS